MDFKSLKQHIRTLIALPTTEAPVISCYQTISNGVLQDRNSFVDRMQTLQRGLRGQPLQDFNDALLRIEEFIANKLLPDARGIAVFSRAGEAPLFLPMQFLVPLPNWIAVDDMPNIYHLVELKDKYDRYVIMIATEESIHILQVNLGAITAQMWERRPDLRKRVGREWTKMHFQRHRKERTRKFLKQTIKTLSDLMTAGAYSHLILAGPLSITSQVKKELPKHLMDKLVDTVPAPNAKPLADVVQATLVSFVEAEQQESRATVEHLLHQLRTGGLAVAGTGSSMPPLSRGQVDVLVMSKEYDSGTGWLCESCGDVVVEPEEPDTCPTCAKECVSKKRS